MAKKRLRGSTNNGDPRSNAEETPPGTRSTRLTAASSSTSPTGSSSSSSNSTSHPQSSSAPPAAPTSRTKRQRTVLPPTNGDTDMDHGKGHHHQHHHHHSHSHQTNNSHSNDNSSSSESSNSSKEDSNAPSAPLAEHPSVTSKVLGACTCKASKCIKLYCECFAAGKQCSAACRCRDCKNNVECDEERSEAIKQILARNPLAFAPKVRASEGDSAHSRGCRCKKSACRKAYCECFAAKVPCTDKCRCVGCENDGPNHHHDHGSSSGAAAAVPASGARRAKAQRPAQENRSTKFGSLVGIASIASSLEPPGNESEIRTPSRRPRADYNPADASPEMTRSDRRGVSPGGSSASLLPGATSTLATPTNALYPRDPLATPIGSYPRWKSPLQYPPHHSNAFGPISSVAPSPTTPVSSALAKSALRREQAGLQSPIGHLLSKNGPGTAFSPMQINNPAALQSGLMSPGGITLASLPLPTIEFTSADAYTPMKGDFSPSRLLPSVLRRHTSRYTSEPASSDLHDTSRSDARSLGAPGALEAPGAADPTLDTTSTATTATTTTTSTATADINGSHPTPDSRHVPSIAGAGGATPAAGVGGPASSHSFPILSVPGETDNSTAPAAAAPEQGSAKGKYTSTPITALPWSLNGDPSTTLTRPGQQVVLDTGGSGVRGSLAHLLSGSRSFQVAEHLILSTPARSSDAGVPATPSSAGSAGSLTPGYGSFGMPDAMGISDVKRATMGPPLTKQPTAAEAEAALLGSVNSIVSHIAGAGAGADVESGATASSSRGSTGAEERSNSLPAKLPSRV